MPFRNHAPSRQNHGCDRHRERSPFGDDCASRTRNIPQNCTRTGRSAVLVLTGAEQLRHVRNCAPVPGTVRHDSGGAEKRSTKSAKSTGTRPSGPASLRPSTRACDQRSPRMRNSPVHGFKPPIPGCHQLALHKLIWNPRARMMHRM